MLQIHLGHRTEVLHGSPSHESTTAVDVIVDDQVGHQPIQMPHEPIQIPPHPRRDPPRRPSRAEREDLEHATNPRQDPLLAAAEGREPGHGGRMSVPSRGLAKGLEGEGYRTDLHIDCRALMARGLERTHPGKLHDGSGIDHLSEEFLATVDPLIGGRFALCG